MGSILLTCCICHACHATGAQTLQLRDNYRSTPQVLRGAEGVLKHMLSTGRTPDRVVLNPLLSEGAQIEVSPFLSYYLCCCLHCTFCIHVNDARRCTCSL